MVFSPLQNLPPYGRPFLGHSGTKPLLRAASCLKRALRPAHAVAGASLLRHGFCTALPLVTRGRKGGGARCSPAFSHVLLHRPYPAAQKTRPAEPGRFPLICRYTVRQLRSMHFAWIPSRALSCATSSSICSFSPQVCSKITPSSEQ